MLSASTFTTRRILQEVTKEEENAEWKGEEEATASLHPASNEIIATKLLAGGEDSLLVE